MKDEFVKVRVLDNFYQTSCFFPMPVVLVSTVAESGQTNLGPYSLCFPHIVAGGDHSMLLISQAGSKTSLNIQRTGVCAINFVPDDKKYTRNCVMLGYPGETTEEKMANSIFTLLPSTRTAEEREPNIAYPEIVQEAVQVFECTWNQQFPMKLAPDSPDDRFVLRIDKIVMKEQWRDCLFKGKGFPRLPVDYGFRDNAYFWFAKAARPYRVPIPKEKGMEARAVKFAADRIDPDVKWQEEAYAKLTRVPRPFLSRVIRSCIEAAKEEGIPEITPQFLDRIRDKRKDERES